MLHAMKNLSIFDVKHGLDNLFNTAERHDLFKTTLAYALFASDLQAILGALPNERPEDRPFARQLVAGDRRHDGCGGAVWFFGEAVLKQPDISEERKSKILELRDEFIPGLSVLKDSYADEVAAAKRNREKLSKYEVDLKSFPTPDGRSLYDWMVDFVDAGDALGALLNQRAGANAQYLGVDAGDLRRRAISLLSEARAIVETEVRRNKSLPGNTEAILFGYFDMLSDFRADAKNAEAPAPPAGEAPKPEGTP